MSPQSLSKHLLKQAIIDFRNDGKQLMEKLGKKYGLDIHIKSEFIQLVSKRGELVPRKGELSRKWNYYFHGNACGFYHKKTQQSVEVVLYYPPALGPIDAWFLMDYMKSTPKYKNEVEDIEWLDLKPIIQELYELGEIKDG